MCLLASCQLAPDLPVEVLAPPLPVVWPAVAAYELSWVDSRGRSGREQVAVGGSCWLWLPRSGDAIVELRLVLPAGDGSSWRSLPLGALYPADVTADGRLQPDAYGGWCASLARPWLSSKHSLAGFNWRRLRQELARRLPDPWLLEPGCFGPILAAGTWRADYLRPPPVRHRIWLPDWLAERFAAAGDNRAGPASPLAEAWSLPETAASGLLLPAGVWRWFLAGHGLQVEVAADGQAWWTCR